MQSKFDIEVVREKYEHYLKKASALGTNYLPYYEIQQWDKVLDPIAKRIYEDIRYFGIPLYPIFPISGTSYLHFANPFNKIGIEIKYKNSSQKIIDRKIKLLESQGWIVYTINSTNTYHTFSEFCSFKINEEFFEDMDMEGQLSFLEENKYENSSCLLLFIKNKHFKNYSITKPIDEIESLLKSYIVRFD